MAASLASLPPELLHHIVSLIYLDSLPRAVFRCLDPHGLPSTYPDGRLISSTQRDTQRTLHALSRVSRAFYAAARPLLFRRLQITLPFSFLLLLRTLGAAHLADAYEEHARLRRPSRAAAGELESSSSTEEETGDEKDMPVALPGIVPPAVDAHGDVPMASLAPRRKRGAASEMSFSAMVAAAGFARATGSRLVVPRGARERLGDIQADEDEAGLQLVWTEQVGGSYSLTLARAARGAHHYPRVLSFESYTTQGMRRTLADGETRFVTPAKLLALITAADGLMGVGFTESMDSAISREVLEGLLFRDGKLMAPSRLRGVSMERPRADRSQRRLQSLDLCGCVSSRFQEGLRSFVDLHLRKFSGRHTSTLVEESEASTETETDGEDERRGRGRETARDRTMSRSDAGRSSASRSQTRSLSRYGRDDDEAPSTHPARATRFPSLRRLGLANVTFPADLITPFVLAFPKLTHLDLTGTRIGPELLNALGSQPSVHLHSLSLARCPLLTSESITELIADSPATAGLVELSLAGTLLNPTTLTAADLRVILTTAPCFRSGALRYLDLSSCPLDDEMLVSLHPQPSLLELGISALPNISLDAIGRVLRERAPNVQVLSIVETGYPLGTALKNTALIDAIIDPCAKTPPMTISQQLAAMGFTPSGGSGAAADVQPPRAPTNLRVIELSPAALRAFGVYHAWRVIFGAGRRGWLVDCAAGPDPDAVDSALVEPQENEAADEGASERGRARSTSRPPRLARSWEPETPPVRRSPAVSQVRRASPGGSNLRSSLSLKRTASGASRSRSRAPPVGRRGGAEAADMARTASSTSSAMGASEEEGDVSPPPPMVPRNEIIRDLPPEHPRRRALGALADLAGHTQGSVGWYARKMEVLLGYGLLGREQGHYAYVAYQQ